MIINLKINKNEYKHFVQDIWPKIESVEGFLERDEAFFLFIIAKSLVAKRWARNIVEIGSYKGKSTVAFAYGLRENLTNLSNTCPEEFRFRIYSIDPFIGVPNLNFQSSRPEYDANIAKAGISDIVSVIPKTSAEAFNLWDANKQISILFIDGNHRYEYVKEDHRLWSRYMRDDGGLVVFHDIHLSGVHEAIIEELFERRIYKRFVIISDIKYLNFGIIAGYREYYRLPASELFEKWVLKKWFIIGGHPYFAAIFLYLYNPIKYSMRKMSLLIRKIISFF